MITDIINISTNRKQFVTEFLSDQISVMSNVLGYEKRDVIAFGDSNNDLPMFQAAGFKVAMGNGSKDLKSQADYVTGALEDGGIRQALEYLNLI